MGRDEVSGRIIALFVISGVLLVTFVASQAVNRDESHVTVPKRVFKDRRAWADAIFGASSIGPFFIMLYYVRETLGLL